MCLLLKSHQLGCAAEENSIHNLMEYVGFFYRFPYSLKINFLERNYKISTALKYKIRKQLATHIVLMNRCFFFISFFITMALSKYFTYTHWLTLQCNVKIRFLFLFMTFYIDKDNNNSQYLLSLSLVDHHIIVNHIFTHKIHKIAFSERKIHEMDFHEPKTYFHSHAYISFSHYKHMKFCPIIRKNFDIKVFDFFMTLFSRLFYHHQLICCLKEHQKKKNNNHSNARVFAVLDP